VTVRARSLVVLVATAVTLAGCRLDVDTTVQFQADDTADVTVSAGFDAPFVDALDRLGFDPLAALTQTRTLDWQPRRIADDDGLLRVGVVREGVIAGDLGAVLGELAVGLSDTDVGLTFDVTVTQDGDGYTLSGTALFTPPSNHGVLLDGVPLGLPADVLQAQVARNVTVWFTVRVDGTVVSHNADVASAREVRWQMPVNAVVPVSVTVQPARATSGLFAVVMVLVTLAGGVGVLAWRRRQTGTDVIDTPEPT
jgi:hypothetical protein